MAELAATAAATGAVGTTGRTAAPPADEPQGGMTQAAPDAEASRLSFRQWLLNGGGLYGVHGERQTSRKRSHGRKKANPPTRGARHSPAGGSDASGPTVSMPNMEAREVYSGGKKKTRRWLNDLLLRELAGPLDAADVTALYAPPPWGHKTERPALERITEISPWHAERLDRPLWDIILSSDMDQRDKFLRLPAHATSTDAILALRTKGHPQGGATRREETDTSASASASAAALLAWRGVTPAAREALKRSAQWPILALLEDKILLLKASAEPLRGSPEAAGPEGQEPERAASAPELKGVGALSVPEVAHGSEARTQQSISTAQQGSLTRLHDSSHPEAAAREEATPVNATPEQPAIAKTADTPSEHAMSAIVHPEAGGSAHPGSHGGSVAQDIASPAGATRDSRDRALIFSADDSFQRLLIHGLCQLHGLDSSSLTPMEAKARAAECCVVEGETDWEGAQRVVLVCQPATLNPHPGPARPPPLKFRLSDILLTI